MNTHKSPQPILLKNYKAPSFLIETVALTLDIFDDRTDVTSVLHLTRNPHGSTSELELMGESMEFVSIKKDGRELTGKEFALSHDRLVVHAVTEQSFTLEIRNRIHPQKNTALEGFYQSGDILCTQCESEGFRKITYFLDRPDVMAKYTTTLIAEKHQYPLLLSNGNRVKTGDLPGGRHFVTWEDPFRKPSYLFAAVAGDLELAQDSYTTRSGRKVALEVYVDKGQGHKTGHALNSLKNSMRWDEETYGLEYDLDIYMIVAVESFNFGAMENKGLNIFNSAYVLADPETATDADFQGVEGVVGHEYFHNWTGNRVTCRDWFQLTLKEGLTVYRDQEFSSDMLSRPVKRIEDVKRLKELQFPEDAGPTAHPIRPSSYIEINNFYTATVYEKGAEVIRMIHTLIGDANFKRGITKYFELFDGKAVTTEDFVHAMELASGKDLTQFRNWYSRPGTPTLVVTAQHDPVERTYRVRVRQVYPTVGTERVESNNVLLVPFKLALFSETGAAVPLVLNGKNLGVETVLELTKLEEEFVFTQVMTTPVPSWNRSFAAPVHVKYDYADGDLLHLVAHDTDAVVRYESLQLVYTSLLKQWISTLRDGGKLPEMLPIGLKHGLGNILSDKSMDAAFKAYLFEIPSDAQMNQELDEAAIEEAHASVRHLTYLIGKEFYPQWSQLYEQYRDPRKGELTVTAYGARALKNRALVMMVKSKQPHALSVLESHFYNAQTMTEEATGHALYCQLGGLEGAKATQHFYNKWKHEPLVMLRWYGAHAGYTEVTQVRPRIEEIEKNPVFRPQVPNDLRGLYGAFIRQNLLAFHAKDGSGYEFIVDRIKRIDAFNPQVASRLMAAFALMPKMDIDRKALMRRALTRLVEGKPSKDVFEMASRYLGQA